MSAVRDVFEGLKISYTSFKVEEFPRIRIVKENLDSFKKHYLIKQSLTFN